MAQPYVSVGDGFAPSASRENALNRFLNTNNGFREPDMDSVVDYSCVPCYNSTADTLPLGATVMINDSMVVDDGVVPIKLASTDAVLWGILLDELAPNVCGTLFVSGVLPFELAGIKTGSYLSPNGQGGLIASDAGRAMYFMEHILLGGGGGGSITYNGEFKIVKTESGYSVINGSSSGSAYCGYVDLRGVGYVPRKDLGVFNGDVYLFATYNKEQDTYSVEIGKLPSPAPVLRTLLGTINNITGEIVQYYQGTGIQFGREYFL